MTQASHDDVDEGGIIRASLGRDIGMRSSSSGRVILSCNILG